ncbi:type I restriction endonuclease subunit R [Streptomyces sp. NBC_01358]|uniref:type I restriction endonuclease subunit R n=1 Tax=Streptomyces sp. NBC_01358 TaxID=2903837 RepID=UPI002E2EE1D8|nr:type I restriction endonuclease [Streptomyces sp. NBC_01358]
MGQPEYDKAEEPLTRQLTAMGWTHLEGGPPHGTVTEPGPSGRTSFEQVVYAERFRDAVARINPGPHGNTWLSDAQLDHLLARVLGKAPGFGSPGRGVAGNLEVTDLLRKGVPSRTVPGWTKGKPEHIKLVDWDCEFENGNDFLAVSQFRVERKGAEPVIPDIVLFVNGLPWAVIECKAPLVSARHEQRAALDAAVEQVIGYAGVDAPQPVAEFVRFAQVLIATDRDHAELGTVTADSLHFAPWRTTLPATEEQVREETGRSRGTALSDQDVLVAGVLRPAHLLSLVRDFTTQAGSGPRTVKIIGRYPQFKAVHKLAQRLLERRGKIDAGEPVDQRGGVVWHTQGSGKSLTMAFLVRHLRSTSGLKQHKVVVVTDRLDLEKQIRGSLASSDQKIYRASSVAQARSYLAVPVPDLVLVTLQKARRDDTAYDGREEKLPTAGDDGHLYNSAENTSCEIVVLIDEAHRGQAQWQHARLRAMLPNAMMVGFTGTPILSEDRKTTEDIFGPFADLYTLRDAERDGAVVPVRYEAYSVPLEVIEKAALDAEFDEKVPDDPEQRERVLEKFARRKEILEAPSVIEAKADYMLRHWARNALPDRFGAQLAAVSRLAAVRYREALLAARDRLVARIEALEPADVHDPMAAFEAEGEKRELLDLVAHRDLLRSIDAAVVISEAQPNSGRKDPEAWKCWTSKSQQDGYIERFQKGLGDPFAAAEDPAWKVSAHGTSASGLGTPGKAREKWHPEGRQQPDAPVNEAEEPGEAPMAFLVVQSMLLTGFDAPVEQVLYLDRALSGAGLLQAVARTNRPYRNKRWGQVVDFVGIGPELARSLGEYEKAHLRELYGYDASVDHLDKKTFTGDQPVRDRLLLQADEAANSLLADLHTHVSVFLDRLGITSLTVEEQREDLLAALEDPLLRADFDELARDFLSALNAVLPRPEALKYEAFAGLLGEVQYLARRRYLDGRDDFSPRRYGAKIRQLMARHLKVANIEQRVPPIELTAPDFMERVNANSDARTRVSYMSGSVKVRIAAEIGSDRARYTRFSRRLDEILEQMRDDFEKAASELTRLVGDMNENEAGDAGAGSGLDPWTERPVHGLLVQELEDDALTPPGADLTAAARALTVEIAGHVRSPDIVHLADTRDRVRKHLRDSLERHVALDWEDTGPLAGLLVELAVERRDDFLRYGERKER